MEKYRMKPLLLPTNDFVFKKVFAENTDLLASLLAATLDVPESEMESRDVIMPIYAAKTLTTRTAFST